MGEFKWEDCLNLGNVLIDSQHRNLFRLTNKLLDYSKDDFNSEVVGETLSKLLLYARDHFMEEEKLLEKNNYPKLEEHKQEHTNFIYKVTMLATDVMEGNTDITYEILDFLQEWLVNHICKTDQDCRNYL